MNTNKKRVILLAASAVGIVLISLLSSRVVPLYDGVGFPDESYRYVNPPSPNLKTGLPPSQAQTTVTISQHSNTNAINLTSSEIGPQVSINVFSHILQDSLIADKVNVQAVPEAPTGKTTSGTIAGNVYHFTAISDHKGQVSFNKSIKFSGYIDLRLPQFFPVGAKILYRSSINASWHLLDTSRASNDVYEAQLSGLGDYALVPSKNGGTSKHHVVSPVLFALAFVLVIIIVLLIVRLAIGG